MICKKCGAYVDNTSLVCDKCGSLLSRKKESEDGIGSIRQGKMASSQPRLTRDNTQTDMPVYGDFDLQQGTPPKESEHRFKSNRSRHTRRKRSYERDAGRPDVQRGVPNVTGNIHIAPVQKRVKQINPINKRTVNWAKVFIASVAVVILILLGIYLYLTRSLPGQMILARQDKSTNTQAIWLVGEEYLDQGYIAKSVALFEQAKALDAEAEIPVENVDGLLLLGAAYEANDEKDKAMELYFDLYDRIAKSRPEAYENMIRLMLEKGQEKEAGELMQIAFENTGVLKFRQQRMDHLPKSPETNYASGRYKDYRDIVFTSPQGYDVYYTTQTAEEVPDSEIAAMGTLFTEPITIYEGVTTFRAVSVSGVLSSDPLTTSYTVYLPSPSSPKANLASGTYKKPRNIKIRPGEKSKDPEDAAANENLTIYYTIDGSEPDSDSPIYNDEEGVQPPSGKVTLKAIAVNPRGKASNAMSVSYKFDSKPQPISAYSKEDLFDAFELNKTQLSAFTDQFGQYQNESEEMVQGFEDACRRLTYDWGSILVAKERGRSTWVLIQVDMNKAICGMPRNTTFGASADDIISKFRDMTQVASPSGNRGLYSNEKGKGKYYKIDDTTSRIDYTCAHADGNTLKLQYFLTNNRVTRVTHTYSYD